MSDRNSAKLWLAIAEVINDGIASDKEKLERIEAYLEVHEGLIKQSFEDMA